MPEPGRLQPRRNPDPLFPFRDRDSEKEIIRAKLQQIAQGEPGALPVMCFWGPAGTGKSWLLFELERLYRRDGLASSHFSRPTIAARLDLDRTIPSPLWRDGRLERARLLQELWRQLAQQIGAAMPDIGNLALETQADALVHQVTAWLDRFTPVILLDTVDDLVREDEESFFWLEEHLIERLALTDRVLFVFAGRGELRRWRRFQVRRRVDLFPLVFFDPLTAGQAVGAGPEVSRVLYRHAFGHPLATRFLAERLLDCDIDLQTASEEEVVRVLTPSLLQMVLQQTTDHILAKVPKALLPLARVAATLRWLNVEPLRYLAERVGTDALGWDPSGKSDAYYLDLIGQLQSGHLVYWDIGKGVFAFPWATRSLLAHELELSKPQLFQEAHIAAYSFHRGHIEAFPAYLTHYLPEVAYHWGILRKLEPSPKVIDFPVWWHGFIGQGKLGDVEMLEELKGIIEADTELQEVWPEAAGVILSEVEMRQRSRRHDRLDPQKVPARDLRSG
ncbi:MAG: hypothetical protein ACP5UQ_09830 [Anaerolineae bacterium]